MAFDPMTPYGPVVTSTVRVVTWNVWSRFGDWTRRYERVEAILRDAQPDLVGLQEVWRVDGVDITGRLAEQLGMHAATAINWYEPVGMESGLGLLSRWPVVASHQHRLPPVEGGDGGILLHAQVDGPRGRIDAVVVALDWRPDLSHVRQRQVGELADFVTEHASARGTTVVCGDFNAPPDSDEIRALTGRTRTVRPSFVLYDAWEVAGGSDPGHTWSNANPLTAIGLLPDRRIDYVFAVWPRGGGRGHPVACSLVGTGDDPPSDHFGVQADLRY